MPSARSALRNALNSELLPALRELGFVGPTAISGNALLHEFKRAAGHSTQVLTVQLEKRGLPRFIVSLAAEPPEGFAALTKRGGTVRQGRVQPTKGATSRAWFRVDRTLRQRVIGVPESSAASVVAKCVALLPEIEAWWQTEASSEHITVLETAFPGHEHAVA